MQLCHLFLNKNRFLIKADVPESALIHMLNQVPESALIQPIGTTHITIPKDTITSAESALVSSDLAPDQR